MATRDVSVVQKGGEAMTFEGGLENFSTDVERAGEKLLQSLTNPKIRVIHVKGYEGVARWRIMEYVARKLKGSDLFDVQIMVKLPKEDWSTRNVQREIVHYLRMREGVEGEDDDDNDKNDGETDVRMEVLLKIYESLIGRRFLLILGDVDDNIDSNAMGVPNIKKVFSYDSKVVYVSSNISLVSEESFEYEDLSIDVLREEAITVASSPTIVACFTPHVVLDCFFYLMLFSISFTMAFKMGFPIRYWIAKGIMAIRDRIEEEEDLIILEKKVDALLIELMTRSMVEKVDGGVRGEDSREGFRTLHILVESIKGRKTSQRRRRPNRKRGRVRRI